MREATATITYFYVVIYVSRLLVRIVGIALQTKLIISVKEFRKLLGKDSANMSDSQVIELIELLTSMGNELLLNNSSKTIMVKNDS